METMNSDTIMARLDALEKENASLKAKVAVTGGVRVTYGEYQGKPIMELSGMAAPIRFGQGKAKMIAAAIDEIREFATRGTP